MTLEKSINFFYYPKNAQHLPTVVMVEPADACTLKCVMCDVQKYKQGPSCVMTCEQFDHILRQFNKIRELIFCGIGEPLLNKNIIPMVRRAENAGIPFINLITNGELLELDNAVGLFEAGLNQLHISIPAVSEEAFRKIRNNPKVSLNELSDKIRLISKIKREKFAGAKIIINIVMNKFNEAELEETVLFCKGLGADGICFVQLTTILGKNDDINLSSPGVTRLFSMISSAGKEAGIEINFLTGNEYGRCYQLWDFIMIHADGNVSPCNGIMPNEGVKIGNIFKVSAVDIWNSPAYKSLRFKVKSGCLANCRFCESGYLIEGFNFKWFKNFYIRPIRNAIARKIKNAF